ncbi:MAG: ATP-binding cassette domain-containing protein [Gemmobacter sp.]|uniref:thiamine ABC transporter ATP-binding protein n=1 Tax=Gemmobacter sp. TaxID=1898957 RepID=UPI001A4AE02E|nr:ATP-binding cassette domain-containing protein [Gemmobacter sp.]MBL8563974.1 ATP-binding cassette domain-containing protein [Gemmobacter sp.]
MGLSFEQAEIRQGSFVLGADLALPPEGHFAVIGPSGAGKSTLFQSLAGFIPLSRGTIRWQGQRIDGLPPGQRPLSILFQDQNLFPHLTVAQNLGLGLDPSLRRLDWAAVEQALEAVGLAGLGPRKPSQLSGGQQSRAALARALLRARPVLLLDEPFAALGPALKAEMLELVARMTGDKLVLMITHDPNDALHFAPQTLVVANGSVQPPRATASLLTNPPPDLAHYLGQPTRAIPARVGHAPHHP